MWDLYVFFCKQKWAYGMRISDWSSDVCSSDLSKIVGVKSCCWPSLRRSSIPPCPNCAAPTCRRAGPSRPSTGRSEERRVGKECVSPWRSRGAPYHSKKKQERPTYRESESQDSARHANGLRDVTQVIRKH